MSDDMEDPILEDPPHPVRLIRVTMACPLDLMEDAAQLARVLGYSEDDEQTFEIAPQADVDGTTFAVASGLMKEGFVADATSPLVEPPWGADMQAAARAQARIVIGGKALPGQITAIIDREARSAYLELRQGRTEEGLEDGHGP